MFVLRFLIHLRALAFVAFTAAAPVAAQTTAPAALPDWPDQAPSVYLQPRDAAADEPANRQPDPVAPASFEAPLAAAPIAPVTIAATNPATNDARRRTLRSDRHLSHAAKGEHSRGSTESLPSFGLPVDSIYTTVTSLAVVLGLFLLGAGLVRRGSKKSNGRLPEEVVSVLGRVPLAARQFAELLRVGNKLVLVSMTSSGVEPLAEITDPAEIDRIVGLCQQSSKKSSTAEFDQVFRQLADETAPVGFLGNESPRIDARTAGATDVFAAYRGGASRA
jgi:flagellar biogenesis protein FliO